MSLHVLPGALAHVRAPSKDLTGLPRTKLVGARRLHLCQGNKRAQALGVDALINLVGNGLHKRKGGLDLHCHVGHFVTQHLVLNELLPKRLPFAGPHDGFLQASSRAAECADGDHEPLVVEVVHDVQEAVVLLSNEMRLGHAHILKMHVAGATEPLALQLHAAQGHAWQAAWDEQQGDALHARPARAHRHCEEVCVDGPRDPLLLPVHYVVPVALLGSRPDVCDIATRVGFADGKRHKLLGRENIREHEVFQVVGAVVDEGRAGHGENREARIQARAQTAA
mmetsp:Transcript_16822/g.42961  ORF Transcript_16822/g.42961 Transcript_16822/m.42961 type:complete len:281 (-) Transcript_16822:321-1163(-)